ncbi:9720_t:CDS:2, partial [Ambispora leptoticha]
DSWVIITGLSQCDLIFQQKGKTIMSNSNLHTLSSPKSAMDTIQGLEIHPKDGNGERDRTRYLQQIPSTIQVSLKVQKYDVSETSPTRSNCSMDQDTGAHSQIQNVPNHNQRIMEIGQGQDHQSDIRNVSHSSHQRAEGTLDHSPTRERSMLLPSRSEWDNYSKNRNLGVRELRGNKFMDSSISMEAGSSDQISHNISADSKSEDTVQELQDLLEKLKNDPRGFHETRDERLLHPEDREYFCDIFGITGVHPVFVDHSGMVVWMFDDRGIMFQWDDMAQNIEYLGIDLRQGLTNYIYHPEKICAIMEDTGELIPVEEFKRRVYEKYRMAKPAGVIWEESQKKSAKKPAKKFAKKERRKSKKNK